MELIVLLGALGKLAVVYGPQALGWAVSVVLGWYIIKKKKEENEEIAEVQSKLLDTKDEYVQKVQEMNDKLAELSKKHTEIVNDISERRVEDLKELTNDYNKLATNTLRTLDRFVVALEVSNDFRKHRKPSGDDND